MQTSFQFASTCESVSGQDVTQYGLELEGNVSLRVTRGKEITMRKKPFWYSYSEDTHCFENQQSAKTGCRLRRRNTRYKNLQLVAQHCFVASFRRCFPFFTLRDQLQAATNVFVAGQVYHAR